jgi:hypothetical protein
VPEQVWVGSKAEAKGHALVDHGAADVDAGVRGPKGERLCWYECTVQGGRKGSDIDVVQLAKAVETLGSGELLVNCIDCDGQNAGRGRRWESALHPPPEDTAPCARLVAPEARLAPPEAHSRRRGR